jgi:hypothetical protein
MLDHMEENEVKNSVINAFEQALEIKHEEED